MSYKKAAAASRAARRAGYADGGFVTETDRPTKPKPGTDRDWDNMKGDWKRGMVTPGARQVFSDNSRGPMNITPSAIKGERRARGGKV